MGDRPMSHRRWLWTSRVCVPLDIDADPLDRVRSAEHAHVVPDVPRTLRRAVGGACGRGETPCQRHVSPRNSIRFESTVAIAIAIAIALASGHLAAPAVGQAGPIRCTNRCPTQKGASGATCRSRG